MVATEAVNNADKVAGSVVATEAVNNADKVVVAKVVETNLVLNLRPSKPRPTPAFSNTMLAPVLRPPWPKRAWRSVALSSRAATS